jgi:hypothetical protein
MMIATAHSVIASGDVPEERGHAPRGPAGHSSVHGRLILSLLILLCAGFHAGCGYALAGRGSFLPDYIKTIGVPTFANRTTVFNLETNLTQKVRAEFIGRGKYRIVPDGTDVDALLVGDVLSATLTPVGFGANQLVSRYALTVTARIELRDLRESRTLWENPSLVFRQEYEPRTGGNQTDVTAFFGQDANALERMSADFARTIVSSILEAF